LAGKLWHKPLLIETLVDRQRFAGTCYRAANWVEVGVTRGRGRQDSRHERHDANPKRIFLLPLERKARQRLRCTLATEGEPIAQIPPA